MEAQHSFGLLKVGSLKLVPLSRFPRVGFLQIVRFNGTREYYRHHLK